MKELLNQLKNLNTVDWVIICIVVASYIPLWLAITKDKKNGAGQNFYTWILWFILDVTQLICIIIAHGTYVMFIGFVPCCFITLLLVRKNHRPIDDFEKVTVALVIICIPIWIVFGEIWAIIIQTIAQVVAGLPLLRDTWKKPGQFRNTLFSLFLFNIVHLICFFKKAGWTIEDTLFPATLEIFTLLSMLPIIMFLIKEKKKVTSP